MPLKVSFEINEQDIRHFRREMRRAREAVRIAEDDDIIAAARQTMQDIGKAKIPAFVRERIDKLESLLEMISDDEWALGRKQCDKVLSALAYFGDPDDLIPDHIPGLGFLDDAIMVELVLRELAHEIDAYHDFAFIAKITRAAFPMGRRRREQIVSDKSECVFSSEWSGATSATKRADLFLHYGKSYLPATLDFVPKYTYLKDIFKYQALTLESCYNSLRLKTAVVLNGK